MSRRLTIVILISLAVLISVTVFWFNSASTASTNGTPSGGTDSISATTSIPTSPPTSPPTPNKLPTPQPTIIQTSIATTTANQGCSAYNINKKSDTRSGVSITKIVNIGNETVVYFRFTNLGSSNVRIRVHPVGSIDAFFIRSVDGTKKFNLTKVSGITLAPDWDTVSPGRTKDFKLAFEKIDPSMRNFDIIEGERVDPDMTGWWDFRDISLSRDVSYDNVRLGTPVPGSC